MTKKIRVNLNSKGARGLLNGPEMVEDMNLRAKAVEAAAEAAVTSPRYAAADSEGFRGDGQPGKSRARALIGTTDYVSRAYNAKHNALLKALDAGR